MSEKENPWVSVSVRPTHGTAPLINIPSTVPQEKQEKEVFWVRELVGRLPQFKEQQVTVHTNEDDADGNHDVVVEAQGQPSIGVQVTELTYELWRARTNQRERYVKKVLAELDRISVTISQRISAKILVPNHEQLVPDLRSANKVAAVIALESQNVSSTKVCHTPFGLIHISPVGDADIYLPSSGNIGVDVDFDELPRSLTMYTEAVNYLVKKKSLSKSPWLVIWSLAFCRDKHWLGRDFIQYMTNLFAETTFSTVYFIESMDGEGLFQANIEIHSIKT